MQRDTVFFDHIQQYLYFRKPKSLIFPTISKDSVLKRCLIFCFLQIWQLWGKELLAAGNSYSHEDHLRNNQAWNTTSPRVQDDYFTRLKEEIESRKTKKLSQEFSWTESRILGTLSLLDAFLLNPQSRFHSGTVPETYLNSSTENEWRPRPNWSDPHPEEGVSLS